MGYERAKDGMLLAAYMIANFELVSFDGKKHWWSNEVK